MEQENKTHNKLVKTYAEDMAEVIQNDKQGLIKKIIHGEEEAEREKKNLSPESRKNKFFMVAGVVLICVALGMFSLFFFSESVNTVPVQEQFTPLIFSDTSDYLEVASLNKDAIAQTVLHQINTTDVKSGGVDGIYLTSSKNIVTFSNFINLIKASFVFPTNPPNAIQNNFLMGIVNGSTKDFFILLKVSSTADVFDSLRTWENKMFSDLHGFFGADISADTTYLLTKNFTDGIIENKNARILYGSDGTIVMMYVFADNNSVIIANTDKAVREIMLRLASSQIKK